MSVTVEDLAAEITVGGAGSGTVRLQRCVDVAEKLLEDLVGAYRDRIPEIVYEEAWLVTAAAIFYVRRSPNGIANQAFGDDNPSVGSEASLDPLRAARALLRVYLGRERRT